MAQKTQKPKNDVVKERISPPTSEKRPFDLVRDWIGLLATGTGVFAALFYMAGRSFSSGYFSAMNIPNYMVSFSIWEYAEVGWIPLLLYTSAMMILGGLVVATVNFVMDALAEKIKKTFGKFTEMGRQVQAAFTLSGIFFFIILLTILASYSLKFVESLGDAVGRGYITENSAQMEVVSADPLVLDDDNPFIIQASGKSYFVYTELHLLTVNGGKYYFFRQLDPVTCKPVKVYVVEEREALQINLLPAVSLSSQCNGVYQTPVLVPLETPTRP